MLAMRVASAYSCTCMKYSCKCNYCQVHRTGHNDAMTSKLCKHSIQAWSRLVQAESLVLHAVERELRAAGFPSPDSYHVLAELESAPDQRLRPIELEARIALKQYHLSRVIDRMQAEQLVERRRCPTDARGQHVALLPAGSRLLKRMWPVYESAICRHFASKLAPGDAEQLQALLDKLLAAPP